MKLKDPGTRLSEEVGLRTFKGKEYAVLRVDYDAEVGSDIWYFYFDPHTYAMEVYQFYRSDENGQTKEDTGEYILLSSEEEIGGIRMPKTRAWYYNKDDKYLGTDILKQ
jgi:cellulose biosynthesis protein BcsQ